MLEVPLSLTDLDPTQLEYQVPSQNVSLTY